MIKPNLAFLSWSSAFARVAIVAATMGSCSQALADGIPDRACWWAAYSISSDPSGAAVYGSDGNYWGTTQDGSPVTRWWWNSDCDHQPAPFTVRLSFRKSGYPATQHQFTVRMKDYRRGSCANGGDVCGGGAIVMLPGPAPSANQAEKLFVVLDTPR